MNLQRAIVIGFSIAIAICENAIGETIVDSLSESRQNQNFVSYNQWLGTEFRMPSDLVNFRLDSVTFTMAGNPVDDLSARIYAADGPFGALSTLLGELDVPANYVQPFIGDFITPAFLAGGLIALEPDLNYYVVLARTDPVATDLVFWNDMSPFNSEPFEALTGRRAVSFDQGQTWGYGIGKFKVRIDVVPIPEPTTFTLFVLGAIGLAARRLLRLRPGIA